MNELPTTEQMISELHYFRCDDCLSAMTVKDSALPGQAKTCEGFCVCGGPVHYIGRVHESWYEKIGQKAPCDGRCTRASGPACNCRCMGKNHGTGKLVDVVVEEGKIRVTSFDQESIDKGNAWRALREEFSREFERVWGEMMTASKSYSCSYTQRYDFQKYAELFDKALKMRVYSRRLKRVEALLNELKASEPVAVQAK
jgi:hypothetical protein